MYVGIFVCVLKHDLVAASSSQNAENVYVKYVRSAAIGRIRIQRRRFYVVGWKIQRNDQKITWREKKAPERKHLCYRCYNKYSCTCTISTYVIEIGCMSYSHINKSHHAYHGELTYARQRRTVTEHIHTLPIDMIETEKAPKSHKSNTNTHAQLLTSIVNS